MTLAQLLAVLDAAGGGLTLRPTGVNIFAPNEEGGWLNYSARRKSGEAFAALVERALERAIARWKL